MPPIVRCKHCGQHRTAIGGRNRPLRYLYAHEALCLGIDERDDTYFDLPTSCLVCGTVIDTEGEDIVDESVKHYKTVHNIELGQDTDMKSLLEKKAVLLPGDAMDFQRGWGCSYSTASLKDASEDLYEKAKLIIDGPAMTPVTADMVTDLVPEYIGRFMDYFKVEPLVFSMHASDCQYSVYAIFSHAKAITEIFDRRVDSRLLDRLKRSGRLAWDGGCYGSAYGPGGYICPVMGGIDGAWGVRPFELDTQRDIESQLRRASKQNCFGVIVEVVRNSDGVVMSAERWETLCKACREYDLILICDEALSAIRCGHPFAYQRFSKKYQPDFVIFGKGLGNCGVAVNWSGPFLSGFDYKYQDMLSDGRREAVTRALGPMDCIRGMAIIELARKQNWTANAIIIGNHLRSLCEGWRIEGVRGSGALLWIPTVELNDAVFRRPIPASSGTGLMRWMPPLDTSPDELTRIFEEDYRALTRRTLERGGITRLYLCSTCGSPRMPPFGRMTCTECLEDQCGDCRSYRHEPNELHRCPE